MAALRLIFISSSAFAQDPIATERPSQSVGSLVLPGNSFLFEQGFTYKNDSLELDGFFRLGVSDIGELRLLTYYDSPLATIGAKVNLLKDKNYRPGIAIKVDLTGAKITDYRLIIMQKLSDQFSANLNVGYASTTYGIIYVAIVSPTGLVFISKVILKMIITNSTQALPLRSIVRLNLISMRDY